ncbi:T6SS immunity protein Tdi1 domain-containing protein [Verrucomicrobium sp. BvORR034]|uniref:T6SS immunity protein Tdi1 domain-containing protein n=1 Tax=Verrucomicrobium sp. BvORR034 TaxID=1396418 RepID=UPI0009DCA573|nr:T6SS immunity protein Tdi1 domain-containing protein [Verrucomicrobium sp. BvORR034]
MTLDPFNNVFQVTANERNFVHGVPPECGDPNLSAIIGALGGKTFLHGLYRVLRSDRMDAAKAAMEKVFPEYRGRIVPFAFDWLGRHFAVDLARIEDGRPQVLMLEIGAAEAMEIPASVADFHNVELVEYADDALSFPFWQQWRASNPNDLSYSECVGYKVPLFLGGADELANLETIDLSVYVEICGQLRNKTRTLAAGQTISRVFMSGSVKSDNQM